MTISASPAPEASRQATLAGPVVWLSYAAAPAFAVMAVVAGLPGDAMPVTCLGGTEPSFLGGMTWMYLLMAIFHLPPWLKLLGLRPADHPA